MATEPPVRQTRYQRLRQGLQSAVTATPPSSVQTATDPPAAAVAATETRLGPPATPAPTPTPAPTNRPAPAGPAPGAYGSPGHNNYRSYAAQHGFAIGRSAQAADPSRAKMGWRDTASSIGVDWSKLDQTGKNAFVEAVYGHVNPGDIMADQKAEWKAKLGQLAAANPNGPGGVGGGAGGGGGASGSVGGDMESFIRDLLNGTQGPYTEEVQAGLREGAQKRRTADILGQNRAATLAAARSGNAGGGGGSPQLQSILAQNAREGSNALAEDNAGIKRDATQANFAARIEGLNQAQALEQRRYQDKWNMAQDDRERQQVQLEHEDRMAALAQEKELAQASAAAAGAAAARNRQWELEDRDAAWQREDFLYQRDLPFRLEDYAYQGAE